MVSESATLPLTICINASKSWYWAAMSNHSIGFLDGLVGVQRSNSVPNENGPVRGHPYYIDFSIIGFFIMW
jgi:hypothetical protein